MLRDRVAQQDVICLRLSCAAQNTGTLQAQNAKAVSMPTQGSGHGTRRVHIRFHRCLLSSRVELKTGIALTAIHVQRFVRKAIRPTIHIFRSHALP